MLLLQTHQVPISPAAVAAAGELAVVELVAAWVVVTTLVQALPLAAHSMQ